MNLLHEPDDFAIVFLDAGPKVERRSSLSAEGFLLCELNGIFVSEEGISLKSNQDIIRKLTLAEARLSGGEWAGIFKSSSGPEAYALTTDPFGYQMLFYRIEQTQNGRTNVYVGTTATGISHLLQSHGRNIGVNWVQAIGTLGTEQHWARTMQSWDTFGADIRVLLPGETLYVGKEGVFLEQSEIFETSSDDYNSLLDGGIEKAIRVVQLAANSPTFSHDINLSGGRDSRMILAMLTASGLASKFSVTTVNPLTWGNKRAQPGLTEDLYVAEAIRRRYGMKWSSPREYLFADMGFDESLQYWQAYRSNQYFYFTPTTGMYFVKGGVTELRGAAGETFRGFQSVRSLSNVLGLDDRPETFKQDRNVLLNYLYQPAQLPESVREQVIFDSAAVLDEMGADSIVEAMNRRYSVFRNRSHFGHARYSLSRGAVPLFPLSQLEFVKAARLLSPKDRTNDRIVFDIIERLNPELNDLRFDNGAWPAKLVESRRKKSTRPRPWDVPANTHALGNFFDTKEIDHEYRERAKVSAIGKTTGNAAVSAARHVDSAIRVMLGNLEEWDPAGEYLTASFRSRLISGIEKGLKDQNLMLARLASIHDFVVGSKPRSSREVLLRSSPSLDDYFHRRSLVSQGSQGSQRTRHGRPFLDVLVKPAETMVEATAVLKGTIEGEMEFAFYLLHDGKVEKKRWYASSNTAVFDFPTGASAVSVKAFARFVDAPSVMFSTTAEVDIK